ncbi:MAG: fumarylacetoacetate hydrolase family protein [Sphingobium sp.]|nr:fumarylacetoacetate hydrolase family protein [Sphingobium sp.]
MKLATIKHGLATEAAMIDEEAGLAFPLGIDMTTLIMLGQMPEPTSRGLPLSSVAILAPIPLPARNIFCVGKNYRAHAQEFTRSGFDSSAKSEAETIPEAPIIFTKVPQSVIASGEPILYPRGLSDKIDYEAELAVVIGVGGRGIDRSDAYDHVFGYTIVNDVTARDLQSLHKQWLIGKSLDSFCPMGPWLVTADEVDVANLGIRCWVNDELRQDANTADLIFDIPILIETLSAGITLQPGDIIATGTPAGVGLGFDPPRFLRPGDRVTVEIDGLGRLVNDVR